MHKTNKKIIIVIISAFIICGLGIAYFPYSEHSPIDNTTITDMANRSVEVPDRIENVIATVPSLTTTVYMIAPEKLAGLNFNWTPEERIYVPEEYQNIPVVGGWFGRQDGNYEQMISANPDVIFEGFKENKPLDKSLETINERQEKFGEIPVVAIAYTTDVTTTDWITFTGQILDKEDISNKLVEFLNTNLKKVKEVNSTIKDNEKKTVYYAEGSEGLETSLNGSGDTHLITLCGGLNVADVHLPEGASKVEVSMEQIITWNPEIIITTDSTFYKKVYNDPKWANIDAVKNKQVYLSPTSPFNWFNRPGGANKIIGIPWTAKVLYPEKYTDINMKELTKQFYKDFYHYDLSDEEVTKILKESGLKEENM